MKTHRAGTREVASGVVLPGYRRRGISTRSMNAVLARERGPLYLMCDEKWAPYYERLGFHRVTVLSLPADFRREYRIGRTVTSILGILSRRELRIIPMKTSRD
ncbi:MAG: GNAT family N-acetyltransferase [Rubrobacter sp.]